MHIEAREIPALYGRRDNRMQGPYFYRRGAQLAKTANEPTFGQASLVVFNNNFKP